MQVIDHQDINSVEEIQMHNNLFVLMASLTNTNVNYLYSIDKSDGAIIMSKKLDTFSNLDSGFISTDGYYSFMLAPRASDIYLGIKFTSNTEMGFLRLSSFSSS